MSLANFRTARKLRRTGAADREISCSETSQSVAPASYFSWHSPWQRLAAVLILVPALPVILFLMLFVRLTSRGPAIYRQTRVGLEGRPFQLYKLRSMRIDAELATGAVWAQLKGDLRITRFGRFLRATHLDELPQLLNVIKGEMVLVGPRPERPEFTHKLALEIPGYMERHIVRPGVTGLAQINLPPDTNLESVVRKLALDMAYVAEGNLNLDIRILACTFARVFCVKGPGVTRFFRVERRPGLMESGHVSHAFESEVTGSRQTDAEVSCRPTVLQPTCPSNGDGNARKAVGHLDPWPEGASNSRGRCPR